MVEMHKKRDGSHYYGCRRYSKIDGAVYPEKLCFALGLCADKASTAKLAGFSVTLNAFASDIGRSVEITRPMGMAGDYTSENDVPTQSVVYPKEALYADENRYYD